MEQSFADLLSDAFSETALPAFPVGDLDFENLNFDERFEEDNRSEENILTKEDEPLQQEVTGQTAVLSVETKDIYMAENVDGEQCDNKRSEEDFAGVGVEDYASSGGESEEIYSASGEEEEEEEEEEGGDMGTGENPGDLLKSVRCSDALCDGNREDRVFAEGQPLALEGAENPQVRNEEQGESESDEAVSYFERFPERGSERTMISDRIEEKEQEREEEKEEDLCDSECEGMKTKQEGKVPALCEDFQVPAQSRDNSAVVSLESPEISVQNLQYLIAEVDGEKYEEKMKDFSGEEHQDAGESIADYPSDFSSCEYVEDGGEKQKSKHQSHGLTCASAGGSVAKQSTCLGRAEDTDEKGDGNLYSRDIEVDAGGESDSYTFSDDEEERRSDEELFDTMFLQDLQSNKELEETRCGSSAEYADYYNRAAPADFSINWNLDVLTTDTFLCEDLLTTEDTEEPERLFSDVTQCPAEDVTRYSVVQRGDDKTMNPSNQGSLDDIFFFNTEAGASGIMELGQLGDDEYEEERNWKQEQERIKAFHEFYDDSEEEHEREGRQIKVQFCADPLSRVIHYESDSSDRDSLSSSTEGDGELSSAETSEELKEPDNTTQTTPDCDPPNTQLPESVTELSNIPTCARKQKWFNMLKLTLKMSLVVVTGLLMFWFATDQADWFSHVSFF